MSKLYSSSKLINFLIYISITGFVVISLALIFIFTQNTLQNYKASLHDIKLSQYKRAKLEAKDKIDKLIDFINLTKKLLYKEEREKLRSSVYLGIEIIDSIYEQYKGLPKSIIFAKIKDKLEGLRFFINRSGYFYIMDLSGNCIMFPPDSSIEGRNMIDFKDLKGNYTLKEALNIIKSKKEGFLSWYWYKPHTKDVVKKLGFIKVFKPLGIYLGIAKYSEDVISSIEKELTNYLHSIDKDTYGYIFAYDYLGNVKKDGESYKDINRWNDTINRHHIIKSAILGAKEADDGFFMHYIMKGGKERVSFVKAIPELKWIIGTQVEENNELFEKQKMFLKEKLNKTIKDTIWLTIILLFVMIVGFLFVAAKVKHLFSVLEKSLIRTNKKLSFQATHDSLTKLPNRLLLLDRVKHTLEVAKRQQYMVAVIFLDIDNFKIVNDVYGHEAGDKLLKQVGKIINSKIRESDTVSRFGGDEFVILLDSLNKVEDIIRILHKILNAFREPLDIGKKRINATVSLGISIYPNDSLDANSLLRYADMAMYRAKSDGKNRYAFFSENMNRQMSEHIKIKEDLKKALKNDEFVLYYQPQIEVESQKLVGFEALVRWKHPERGLVYPSYFIEIAEESDLIVDIGNIVLKKAMKQMKEWYDMGYNPGIMSVNFASRQLESKKLFKTFKNYLKDTGCKTEWIEVEVIERYLAKDMKKSIKMLRHLRELGLGIAIDDFGTGYSSLSYLKNLPITKLKIDKSFIDTIVTDSADKAIAKSIIDLAKGLGVKVLAEGVEDENQFKLLKIMGCEIIQGYYFYRPLPQDEAEKLLENMI